MLQERGLPDGLEMSARTDGCCWKCCAVVVAVVVGQNTAMAVCVTREAPLLRFSAAEGTFQDDGRKDPSCCQCGGFAPCPAPGVFSCPFVSGPNAFSLHG